MKKTISVIGMTIGFLVLSGLCTYMISADTPKEMKKKVALHPARTNVKPKIDGVLDEEIWQTPPLETPFTTYYPNIGAPAPYETKVWVSHDSKNLYFAFLCLDPEPKKIKTSVTQKDHMFYDDWVGIALDPLGTKQTTWGLAVNPNGIQGDILVSVTNAGEEVAAGFTWESAGKVTGKGYQIKIAIPLRNLNFKSGKEVKMGVLFWRNFPRYGLRASWPERIPGGRVFGTQTPIIYKDLKSPLKLDLQPNVFYSSTQQRANPYEWGDRDVFKGVGIDVKYGITSSITADITVNPDFSQVESDAFLVEVNRRYPLFYPERRSYFKEGVDIFRFFTLPPSHDQAAFLLDAVHTRQIADPAWGARVNGAAGRVSFGILAVGDEQPGQPWESALNPNEGKNAFWGIARGKYSLGKENYLGFIYSGHEFADEHNRVFGTDLLYRVFKKHLVQASFLHSSSSGASLNDENVSSSNFNISYFYMTNTTSFEAGFEHIGAGFRMDSAFLKRTGINHGTAQVTYNFRPKSKKFNWLKQISTYVRFHYVHDLNTGMDDSVVALALDGRFLKYAYTGIRYYFQKESWMGQTFDVDEIYYYGNILLTKWLKLHGEFLWGKAIYYHGAPPFAGRSNYESFYLDMQPSERLNLFLSYSRTRLSKDGENVYDVKLLFSRAIYQLNKNIFLRALVQYNSYQKKLMTDFLASFTLNPGTVLHVGYGGLYENRKWQDGLNGQGSHWLYRQGDLLHVERGFFAKVSYLWRF